jgi:hypothetical protein
MGQKINEITGPRPKVTWEYIAGFLDGGGTIQLHKSQRLGVDMGIRLFSRNRRVLDVIAPFIGFSSLTRLRNIWWLQCYNKKVLWNLLYNVSDKIIAKKEAVDYLLRNFDFERGTNNKILDIRRLRSMQLR